VPILLTQSPLPKETVKVDHYSLTPASTTTNHDVPTGNKHCVFYLKETCFTQQIAKRLHNKLPACIYGWSMNSILLSVWTTSDIIKKNTLVKSWIVGAGAGRISKVKSFCNIFKVGAPEKRKTTIILHASAIDHGFFSLKSYTPSSGTRWTEPFIQHCTKKLFTSSLFISVQMSYLFYSLLYKGVITMLINCNAEFIRLLFMLLLLPLFLSHMLTN